jgi:hypothetical protein
VNDPALRSEIMRLRKDASANALMGAAFTQQNAAQLARRIGRPPSEGELYLAHFFGPHAAAKAIRLAGNDPTANAVAVFPAAAAANPSIFYDKQNRARSVAGVCAELMRRHQVARTRAPLGRGTIAAAPRPPALIPEAVAPAPRVEQSRAAPAITAPEQPIPVALAFATQTEAAGDARPAAPQLASEPAARPVFHSLYQEGDRRSALSPLVAELWGGQTADAKDATRRLASAGAGGARAGFDLFGDLRPDARALFERKG